MQKDFAAFHAKLGVKLQAYAPIASSAWTLKSEELKNLVLFEEPVIKSIAAKYGKSPAQIVLNWHIYSRGHIIIPKTSKVERLSENLHVYEFKLTEEEYASISGLDRNSRFFNPLHISL